MSLLLLDADTIIFFHQFGVWDKIVEKNDIHLTSIIAHEAIFYYDGNGKKQLIDLTTLIEKNKIAEHSVSLEDLVVFTNKFDSVFQADFHEGEKEALAFLAENSDEFLFCTCDKAAIIALALLELAENGISYERVLQRSGLIKPLSRKHTEASFQKNLDKGKVMRIQNQGITS